MLNAIRRDVKKLGEGINVSIDDIQRILVTEVLKRELIENEKAKEAQKRVSRVLNKKKKETKKSD